MVKNAKKRAKGDQKGEQSPSLAKKTSSELGSSSFHSNFGEVGKNRELCPHIDRGITLDKLSSKLGSSIYRKCEDCQGTVGQRKAKKGKGKNGKKGGNESKAIWICLSCAHFSCGGVGLPTTPLSHALRHAKQNHHPLVAHNDNHQLIWCFQCSKLIQAHKPEDNVDNDILSEAVKILKDVPVEGSSVDVDDIWFGSGTTTTKCDSFDTSADGKCAYSARGLVNLGNTCFFNSILQNLLVLNKLRGHFMRLEESVGPISSALRKIFLETRYGSGLRGTIDPKSLLGSLCAKAPRFKGFQQHDSHELLRCLLESLSIEELNSRKVMKKTCEGDSSFVDTVFGGQLSSTVSCLKCGHASTVYEPFLDISLPIPTKKPPSKRVISVTRSKKQKPLPKRSRNNLPKVNRPTCALHGEKSSDQQTPDNDVPEFPSVFQPEEQVLVHSGDCASPGYNIALDMGLTTDDLSAINDPTENKLVGSIGDPTLDSFCWLDYVGPDENKAQDVEDLSNHLLALGGLVLSDHHLNTNGVIPEIQDDVEADNISTYKFDKNQSVPPCDVSLSFSLCHIAESSTGDSHSVTATQPCGNSDMENVPCPSEGKKNAMLDFSEILFSGDPFSEEVAHSSSNMRNSTELGGEVLPEFLNASLRVMENSAETQDSSLNKDVTSSVEAPKSEAEASSRVLGDNEELFDFCGFGDLFNEPEVTLESKPSNHPVSDAIKTTRTEITRGSSESDSNEVDNGGGPVSVESCIACFIKPELLSKDEHAWQCDGCSKVLQQKIDRSLKKVQKSTSDKHPSVSQGLHKLRNEESSMNEILEQDAIHSSGINLPSLDADIHETGKVLTGNCAKDDANFQVKSQRAQMTNALHGIDPSCSTSQIGCLSLEDCDSDEDGFSRSRIASSKGELDEDLRNMENMKVTRDATKTILINKAPCILTIHLKRFSQDVRGRLIKLNGHVSFRETINLTPYMDPRCTAKGTLTYRLVGVVEHSGTMRCGHYIAYVRGTKINGECVWYYASDSHIRETSLEEVLHCEAYILFYEAI